jgi:hypothetical protein
VQIEIAEEPAIALDKAEILISKDRCGHDATYKRDRKARIFMPYSTGGPYATSPW